MLILATHLTAYAAEMDMKPVMESSSKTNPNLIEALGVVNEIDETKGSIKISHEAIKSLDWPAMTMNFMVQDKKLLRKLVKGKQVHFSFIKLNGKYVITDVK